MSLKKEIANYKAARDRLLKRVAEIQETLEHVKRVLGPELWSTISATENLDRKANCKRRLKSAAGS